MDSTENIEYIEEDDKKDVKQETGMKEYFEEETSNKTFKNNEYFTDIRVKRDGFEINV